MIYGDDDDGTGKKKRAFASAAAAAAVAWCCVLAASSTIGIFVEVTAFSIISSRNRRSSSGRFSSSTTTSTTTTSSSSSSSGSGSGSGDEWNGESIEVAGEREECDVLVLGSGPAGRSIASLLSSGGSSRNNSKLAVVLADANYDRSWAPNYGVWQDEWEAVSRAYANNGVSGLDECVDVRWDKTDCYFGGSFDIPLDNQMRIDRPYQRIDRDELRRVLSPPDNDNDDNDEGPSYKVIRANHISQATDTINVFSPRGTLVHDAEGSTIVLRTKDQAAAMSTTSTSTSTSTTTIQVRAKLIIDATGHESTLILRDQRTKIQPPGYQIAYGIFAEIDETTTTTTTASTTSIAHYDKSAMTLFDYRTDHIPFDERKAAQDQPTFMYVMPLGGNRVFFEETSLVARPAMSFETCKRRCYQRLRHLNITLSSVQEEEFCYIPMGGPLPSKDQRLVALSTTVHPSTGYNICRVLMAATAMSEAVLRCFDEQHCGHDPSRMAARAYHALWSPDNVRQRDFAVFGGEFLMRQNVVGLRGFFDGFFRLPVPNWSGFLAGWPGLPYHEYHATWYARIWFGLQFIAKLPPPVALSMALSIVTTSLVDGGAIIRSVTPLWGEPDSYEDYGGKTADEGDQRAKQEAKDMITTSTITNLTPVAFGDQKAEEEEE